MDVTIMSDFMNRDTNRLFTETEWRGMIDEIHLKKKKPTSSQPKPSKPGGKSNESPETNTKTRQKRTAKGT